jgi:N6-L-threonylcarbamoyladenine synthase
MPQPRYILAIESSCDDTGVAVIRGNEVLSNVIANQSVHAKYGGVVPELASRAHAQNIVPTLTEALNQANITPSDLSAVAYTYGPGLMGSLHVGVAFAKSWAWAHGIPSIPVNHMQAHVLAHFLGPTSNPEFPFICLTVSGGHTQLVKVKRCIGHGSVGRDEGRCGGRGVR